MHILLAMLLAISGSEPIVPPVPDECTVEVPELERAATSRQLTPASWKAFRDVARIRLKRGIEALPGMVGCPDLTHAAAELRSDAATRSSLRRAGISAKDYVQIGWTLLVAYDPESFQAPSNPVVASNIAFVVQHRAEIESLMHGP